MAWEGFTTAEQAALTLLPEFNGSAYDAGTNPHGFDEGGYETQFFLAIENILTAIQAGGRAAEEAGAAAAEAATYIGRMSGSSTSAVTIGGGQKTFVTQEGKFFEAGRDVKVVSASDPDGAYMTGVVASYGSGSMVLNVVTFVGSGEHDDWLIYVTGATGRAGTISSIEAVSVGPYDAPTVENEGTDEDAELVIGIPKGAPAGLHYRWLDEHADSDPNVGRVKVNSTSLTEATEMYISETDDDGRAVAALIKAWGASTSLIKAEIRLIDPVTPQNFVAFNVTAAVEDNGGWDTLQIAHVDHGGTIEDGQDLYIQAALVGSVGSPGEPGAAATIAIAETITGAPGTQAAVTNIGTAANAQLRVVVPAGLTGIPGAPVAATWAFDTPTEDADPGAGRIRFNSADPTAVTVLFIDNVENGGASATAWLDSLDDSTNTTSKGEITIIPVLAPLAVLKYRVTGAVLDGTGYRKVPVAYVMGLSLPTVGATLGIAFDRAGDKGFDGEGAGDVVGPAAATDNAVPRFDGTSGKLLKDGVVLGDLATLSTIDESKITGTIPVSKGGTGAADASGARTALGLVIGTNIQGYSAKLAALDGLTWANNKGLLLTGAGSVSTYDLTSYGRSLVGVNDEAALKALINAEAGVDFQGYSATLTAWAGKTVPSGTIADLSSAQTFTNKTFTSPVLNTPAMTSPTATGRSTTAAVATTSNDKGNSGTSTQTFDVGLYSRYRTTNTGAHTWALSNWPATGTMGIVSILAKNPGANTITLPSGVKWRLGDGTSSTTFADLGFTLPVSGEVEFMFWSDDGGTTIYGSVG